MRTALGWFAVAGVCTVALGYSWTDYGYGLKVAGAIAACCGLVGWLALGLVAELDADEQARKTTGVTCQRCQKPVLHIDACWLNGAEYHRACVRKVVNIARKRNHSNEAA